MKESRFIGLAVAALGALTLLVLIPYGIVSPSDVKTLALAPEFWPLIIAAMFTLMGALLVIWPSEADADSQIEAGFITRRLPRMLLVLALLFTFYFLIPHAGMVLPAMIVIFVLSWFAGERRWHLLVILAVAIPALLTVFFTGIANIPIPLGIFEFIYA